jgi:hypothetical protein
MVRKQRPVMGQRLVGHQREGHYLMGFFGIDLDNSSKKFKYVAKAWFSMLQQIAICARRCAGGGEIGTICLDLFNHRLYIAIPPPPGKLVFTSSRARVAVHAPANALTVNVQSNT